jgi:hypothetical protein
MNGRRRNPLTLAIVWLAAAFALFWPLALGNHHGHEAGWAWPVEAVWAAFTVTVAVCVALAVRRRQEEA